MNAGEDRRRVPPGIRWGPFTLRIPFVHARVEWPELIQGLVVAGATGLAVVPLFTAHFGMNFETAIALVIVQSVLLCSSPIVFGEPFCPGWLTPALPLILAAALPLDGEEARTGFVTAVVLCVAAVFLFFGFSGLGPFFLRWIPSSLKAGIILGAGLSAILGEFEAAGALPSRIERFPVTIAVAVGVSLLLIFSLPVERYKARYRSLAVVAGLGMAPGFLVAMVIGPWVGEVDYGDFFALFVDPHSGGWTFHAEDLLFIPDFGALWEGYSPLVRGFPGVDLFVKALPLAVAVYVIGFGDIVTGTAILKAAHAERPDEDIPFDERRTHLSLGIRNALQAFICGPFFPLQGILWTGAMVVVGERYRRGREAMQSIYSGIFSYYVFGIPVLFFFRPLLELFQPVLSIALSLTLLLTGFACAYVALAIPQDRVERGLAVVAATLIAAHSTWLGLAFGFLGALLLLGRRAWRG